MPGGHGKHGKLTVLFEEELGAVGLLSLQRCFAACRTLRCQKARQSSSKGTFEQTHLLHAKLTNEYSKFVFIFT